MYHGGLESLIGAPNPSMLEQMEWEHTRSWYARERFGCWYLPDGTTACAEFEYVRGAAVEVETPNETRDKGHAGWLLAAFMELPVVAKAGLKQAEVLALRLYSGPMYAWYNAVLRYTQAAAAEVPARLAHIALWRAEHSAGETPFTTTIHVLNSAILKLSRVQPATKVYRGTKGGVLPEQFWEANKDNVKGGIGG